MASDAALHPTTATRAQQNLAKPQTRHPTRARNAALQRTTATIPQRSPHQAQKRRPGKAVENLRRRSRIEQHTQSFAWAHMSARLVVIHF